jgi:SET domain-containing protein 6
MSLRDEFTAAKREWEDVVTPCFDEYGIECAFEDYHAARTVVSSRAFTVSPNDGVGLVPIADAFNHRTGGHDVNVGDGGAVTTVDGDTLCVRITKEDGVKEGDEIFNTYGFLGNAKLLNSYGFTQEHNPADEVSINTANIRAAAALAGFSGAQISNRFDWIESSGLCASDASFTIGTDLELSIDILAVVWACVVHDDIFHKFRHTSRRDDALSTIETIARAKGEGTNDKPTLTKSVADVLRRTIERRLSLYIDPPSRVERSENERLESVARLIASERHIFHSILDRLESTHVANKTEHQSNKKIKVETDAFALFD